MKEKKFIERGYVTVHVTAEEEKLLKYLYTRNVLKFRPEVKEIYGYEEVKSQVE